MRNYSIKELKISNQGHELDEYANAIVSSRGGYRDFYLVGDEKQKDLFVLRMGKAVNFVDEYIPTSTGVICVDYERKKYDEAEKEWLGKGLILNRDFFQGEVFEAVYNVYEKDYICIDRVEVFLTNRCTLNCEKCIAYIPYFRNNQDTPLEVLKRDADLLFEKVDFVKKIKLLGGEGFLYSYLPEYLYYLHNNYGDKIGSIRIGTNGTIIPKDELINACRDCGVTVDISDYRISVPGRCRLEEVQNYIEKCGIKTDVKRTGEQWLDMGFPNDIPVKRTEEQEKIHFNQCAMFCRQFVDGKFYFCCSNFAAVRAGLFEENSNDYFDFNREFTKKELLEYELGYSKLGHTSFCEVCRGCSDEANNMHVEVAKQAKGKLEVVIR